MTLLDTGAEGTVLHQNIGNYSQSSLSACFVFAHLHEIKCNPFFAIRGYHAAIHGHAQQVKNFETPTAQHHRWAPERRGYFLVLVFITVFL
jgi:hypothetical protein